MPLTIIAIGIAINIWLVYCIWFRPKPKSLIEALMFGKDEEQ